ncbi:hypothetical protein EYF80_028580 [Liparis tanakae]|uniref:Uncharacterized protein n=1 Tax=Liparis tanakae TaxID=230148 RepID=A0A4Z2H7I2_9TELE|nr:hypothetical protein EYF80_028580 [Liparis tanakae]
MQHQTKTNSPSPGSKSSTCCLHPPLARQVARLAIYSIQRLVLIPFVRLRCKAPQSVASKV